MADFIDLFRSATSYKSAYPETNDLEARGEVKQFESAIYRDAISKADYYQRCNDKIQEYNHLNRTSNDDPTATAIGVDEEPTQGGQTIGPYPNCTYITTGVFSTIYRTVLSESNPPLTVALKLTTPSQCQPPHNPNREARILSTTTHPHIIPLISTHTVPHSQLLLVFPFQRYDLSTLLQKPNPQLLSPQNQKTITRNIFSALAHLHSKGIIHRDIKPSNILLSSPSGPAYLADFGIAWLPNDPSSEPAHQKITDVGTTCYRPPELLFGKRDYGAEIDLWAAGCVVAEVVRGTTEAWNLFDAGELGSELALVKSIFETLGTPNETIWPETKNLPDWGKMTFIQFPGRTWKEILPDASEDGRDLVSSLVRYQGPERLSAEEVLEHAFLKEDEA